MGLFSRIFGGKPRQRDSDDDRGWTGSWWSAASLTGLQINQQTALSATAVMGCVSAVSEDIANLTPQIWRQLDDGSRRVAADHFLYDLLAAPTGSLDQGGWMTWGEWCQMMVVALMLRGNAYAVVVRNNRGQPIRLIPVNPDCVALWEAQDGSLFWRVTRAGLHQMAVLQHEPLMIPYGDVMHWKGLTLNGLLGLSKIALNREAIGLSVGQEQLSARTIGSGAKPAGVLTTDQKLTPEAAKRMKQDWTELNSGLANAGRTAVLELGLKYQPITLTMADMEFLASRRFQLEEVARIWRVPLHMLNAEQGRSAGNNIAQKSQEYLNQTLRTYIRVIRERFTFSLGLPRDLYVDLDVSELLKADLSARYAAYRFALQTFATVNEVRRAEGLERLDDPAADMVFRPVNMAPLNSDVFLGADLDPSPNAAGLGSDEGGENPGAGNPDNGPPNPDQHPKD